MIHEIHFKATPTGDIQNGQDVLHKQYHISGEEEAIFCMLCEVIDLNPQFRKMVVQALKFYYTHDKENCPHCNP